MASRFVGNSFPQMRYRHYDINTLRIQYNTALQYKRKCVPGVVGNHFTRGRQLMYSQNRVFVRAKKLCQNPEYQCYLIITLNDRTKIVYLYKSIYFSIKILCILVSKVSSLKVREVVAHCDFSAQKLPISV